MLRRFLTGRTSVASSAGVDPLISRAHGLGYDAVARRYILAPHPTARVVLVDGTTSSNGNIYHAVNLAAGRALMRSGNTGDWLLLPAGGGQPTPFGGWFADGARIGVSGVNSQYPAVLGTFDPADPEDSAKWLKGHYVFDATGAGKDTQLFGGGFNRDHIAVVGIVFRAGLRDEGASVSFILQQATGILFDGCVFDRVSTNIQGLTLPAETLVADVPDSYFLKDVTFNSCGWGYHNSYDGGRSGNSFDSSVRRLRYQYCINHHGGWSEDHTRSTPSWYSNPTTRTQPGDGIKSVFNFSAVKIHTANTPDPVLVTKTLKTTGASTRLVRGTDYTVAYTQTDPVTTGFVVTLLTGALGAEYNLNILPRSNGPDIYRHNWYINDLSQDVAIIGCIGSWDASHAKWTGGEYVVANHIDIRSPIGFGWSSIGNTPAAWANGSTISVTNYLQIGSDDINYDVGWTRGMGPWLQSGLPGSVFTGGVLLNQAGSQPGGVKILSSQSQTTWSTDITVKDSIFANWRFENGETAPTGTNIIRRFEGNIWDEPSSGTNVLRSSMTNTVLKNAIAACLARNVHTTFRVEQAIPVVVDADPLVTEDRVCAYMFRHPTERDWNGLLRAHMLAPLYAVGWGVQSGDAAITAAINSALGGITGGASGAVDIAASMGIALASIGGGLTGAVSAQLQPNFLMSNRRVARILKREVLQ